MDCDSFSLVDVATKEVARFLTQQKIPHRLASAVPKIGDAVESGHVGRAMEDGKMHQMISIRNDATGKDFMAYLIGKNVAVVGTLTAEQEQRIIREAQ